MKLRIVAALGLVTRIAFADADAPPREGNQWVPYQIEIDQSALPKDSVLGYVHAVKWSNALYDADIPSSFVSPLKGQRIFYLIVVPRAELGKVTVKELQQRGVQAVRVELPVDGELRLGDRRRHVTRKARLRSVVPLSIEPLEDVFESESGEALCRLPPLEQSFDPQDDPCVKKSPTEQMSIFLGENRVWLATGLASAVLIGGVWFAIRRRKKPAS